jgi:formylglycine-generating enzyme required for sulfatase activity
MYSLIAGMVACHAVFVTPCAVAAEEAVATNRAELVQIDGDPGVAAVVGTGDATTLRLAIEDLIATFGGRYPRGPAFLARLDALDARRDGEAIEALAREALLANPLIDFDTLLMVRRPVASPHLGLPTNWQGNSDLPRKGFDDAIVSLSPIGPHGRLATVHATPGRFLGDVDLHPDGTRLLFSSVNDAGCWRVFELSVKDGKAEPIQQIEEPDVANYDAAYLPDGRIIFGSTATYVGVPCVNGSSHVANLYRVDPATGAIDRLTVDQEHDWNPTILPDGHVLYQRWEYADTPHSNSRFLFTMNPDGTNQRELSGASSYFPNSFFYPRPVPGTSGMIAGIVSGHHGTRRSGRLMMLDPARGRREAEGFVREFPARPGGISPIVRDRLVDGVWPQFLHPWPLSEKHVLVAAKLSPDAPWAICLVDAFNNIVRIKEAPDAALLEPIPLGATMAAPVIPDRIDRDAKTGTVYVADVYRGEGLAGIPSGSVKRMRVVAYYYGSRGMGGVLGSIGMDGPWDIRHVLGTVPVEADGSVSFEAPADTPISLQPLDHEGKAVQQMRSWLTVRPGERVSCTGCHDQQSHATPNDLTLAQKRGPVPIEPWYGPPRGFSFAREVQPVLDRHCGTCHHGQTPPDLRGDSMITDWSSQISGHAKPDVGGKFSEAYAALHRLVRRPGIESDMHVLPPMDFHADSTELVQMLREGHHGVVLDSEAWDRIITWIDLNAPYHGTWGEILGEKKVAPVVARRRELDRRYGGPAIDYEWIPPGDVAKTKPVSTMDAGTIVPTAVATQEAPSLPDAAESTPGASRSLPSMAVDLGDGITLELVKVPAGSFAMGDGAGAPDERPRHAVLIEQPFWIGRVEVSNEQFARFDASHDSRRESRHGYQFGRLGYPLDAPKQPVVRVSWERAMAFCEWLHQKTGHQVTLPTEAQWEYACRAGGRGRFSFDGDYDAHANLGDRQLTAYAACTATGGYSAARVVSQPGRHDDWVPHDERLDDGAFVAAPVGSYRANPWGLHDMHGNVWEWTRSLEKPYPVAGADGRDDLAAPGRRIVRGGSWYDRPHRAASSYRLGYHPWQPVFNVGFRIAILDDPDSVPPVSDTHDAPAGATEKPSHVTAGGYP